MDVDVYGSNVPVEESKSPGVRVTNTSNASEVTASPIDAAVLGASRMLGSILGFFTKEAAKPKGKGMQNEKVAKPVERGKKAHKDFSEKVKAKEGWESEPNLIDPATGKTVKPDAVSPSGRPVELKPNTPSGRAKGKRQIKKYERATGKKGRVIYYDP